MAAHDPVRTRTFKLTVCFEARPDGGLRAYSPLGDIREALESNDIVTPKAFVPGPREYVAIRQ
jgi:hypothetical protein